MAGENHPVARFGLPGPLRDRLVSAVLRGEKTATSSLLAEWDADHARLPEVGDRLTVVDSDDRPVAVIEVTAAEVIRLGDADMAVARAEGEGFSSAEAWRRTHERFWRERVIPRLPAPLAAPLDDDTQIVVERFRVVSDV
ncbi:MAG: ASCH domain-containing protein [Solirubrobacterales bacterium]